MDRGAIFLTGAIAGAGVAVTTLYIVDSEKTGLRVQKAYNSLTMLNLVGFCGTVWMASLAGQFCTECIRDLRN